MLLSYEFFKRIVSKDNLSTLLLSILNTIEHEQLKEQEAINAFNSFYQVLRETFDLRLGENLLTVYDPLQIETALLKQRPYFYHIEGIESCYKLGRCNISMGR